MNFHHDAPNSHVQGINFLELLVHALSITSYHSIYRESAKHACTSHTVSSENSLYLLVSNAWFGWNIYQLKIYNTIAD